MTSAQFAQFSRIRDEIKLFIGSMQQSSALLLALQRELYRARGYREEELESAIVYNTALDEVTEASDPRYIIVADNPGIQEQKIRNQRYLIGQSGKLATSWFRANLGVDFRSATVIINKTPIHTPKTAELRVLIKLAGTRQKEILELLDASQRAMARFALELSRCLDCPLWVCGIGELKPKGLFRVWADELSARASEFSSETQAPILLFRHFSMNQFAIEYAAARKAKSMLPGANQNTDNDNSSASALAIISLLQEIGIRNRKKLLGF